MRVTYHCSLEVCDHLGVPADRLFVSVGVNRGHINRNVSVRLLHRRVNLVRKLRNVMACFGLRLQGWKIDLLNDSRQALKPLLRLFVPVFFTLILNHSYVWLKALNSNLINVL